MVPSCHVRRLPTEQRPRHVVSGAYEALTGKNGHTLADECPVRDGGIDARTALPGHGEACRIQEIGPKKWPGLANVGAGFVDAAAVRVENAKAIAGTLHAGHVAAVFGVARKQCPSVQVQMAAQPFDIAAGEDDTAFSLAALAATAAGEDIGWGHEQLLSLKAAVFNHDATFRAYDHAAFDQNAPWRTGPGTAGRP